MGIISYAQNFEDVLLNRVFGGVNYGFYVDIGAYHPVDDNVTKAFYDRGWSGLNIEPGEVFPELAAARPRDINLNMAVYDRGGEISFAQHPGWYAGLSHVQEGEAADAMAPTSQPEVTVRTVACDTLTNILATHASRRPIAFLKIDAEGAELAIIRSTDWRAIRPTVLLIEATMPLSNQLDNHDWEAILLEQGYLRAYFDGINCFYVPEERRDLLRHFELPVNVLDGWVRYDAAAAKAREELQAAHERIHALSTEFNRISAENTKYFEQEAMFLELMRVHTETAKEHYAQLGQARNEVAAHEADRAMLEARQQLLLSEAARLHRLIRELRWPDGPGAIRVVLPLARLIRRLRGTPPPGVLPEEASIASLSASISPAAGPVTTMSPAPPRRSLSRRIVLFFYAPFRVFIRPVAWRSRVFLTGELRADLARLEHAVQQLIASEANRAALQLQAAELEQFAKMLETTLLTLALERNHR
jgi:FkbM family methyltransferase